MIHNMKPRAKHVFALGILGFSSTSLAATCTQTLSPGANVSSAVSSAAAGSVICLNSGSYSNLNLQSVSKSSDVTIRSTSGNGASIYAVINQSSHIRLESLTLSGVGIDTNQQGGSKNITIVNNKFTGQAVLNMANNANSNILIDGNTFDGISACTDCYEGRVTLITYPWNSNPSGVVISNNHFGGAGESDGIQIGSYGVQVGPGNVFDGIKQLNYQRHVDSIQLYGASHTTIIGNFFINNSVQIMAPDGGDTETITQNVFVGNSDYGPSIQFGSHINDVITHNTIINVGVQLNKKTENTTKSSNVLVRDNILVNSDINTYDGNGVASCSNCTIDHNQFSSSGYASGTNNIIGSPTFIGGSSPTTMAGYQLASSSIGYHAATDSTNMGSNYTGGGTVPSPTPSPTVTASPTPTPTPTPSPTPTTSPSPSPSGSQTLLTTQIPDILSASDGAAVNYELGMKFYATQSGQIQAIRFYKSADESGTHVGKIYSASGSLLAQVTFSGESASGWQQQALNTPLTINANTTYVVSVNTGNTCYVATNGGMASQISNGSLRSVVGSNGVYGSVGAMPSQSWQDSNYFRDIVFTPSSVTPSPTPSPSPTPVVNAPSNLKVYRVTSTLVRVNWLDNSSNETGFVVERAVGSSSATFSKLATKAANSTYYRDTTVVSGKTYCYRVKAIIGTTASSSYSNTVCASVP
jgi:hypothetical protein